MRTFKRNIIPAYSIGKVLGGVINFRIEIAFSEDGVLSLCGDWGGGGQIYENLSDERLIPAEGFEYADLLRIQDIWERWHLNDMRSGTPRQEEFVRNWRLNNKYDYSAVCKALLEANLLHDNGYKYGSRWLKEEVPDEIIQYLFSLPAVSGHSWEDIRLAKNPINQEDFLAIISKNS